MNKIYLNEAIDELGLSSKPKIRVLEEIINLPDLPLYFDTTIDGTEATGYEVIEESEEISYALVDGSPPQPIMGKQKKVIEAHALQPDDDYWIAINHFESNGIQYCPVDDSGVKLNPATLRLDDFYFDLAEFNKSRKVHDNLPPYLDLNSERYAPEIDLAIQLHKSIQIDGDWHSMSNKVDKVEAWFDKNRNGEEVSEARLKMFSVMIKGKQNK